MKNKRWLLAGLMALTGAASQAAELADHWYSMRDGQEYGYERDVSAADRLQGRTANPLLMLKYAGQKDGVQQIFGSEGSSIMVMECDTQCEFIKVSAYSTEGGPPLSVDRVRADPDALATHAMQDARYGKLEPFVAQIKKKPHHVWFDKTGAHFTPVK